MRLAAEQGATDLELTHSTTAVYMMASRRHGTIYVGVTGQFLTRIAEHREGLREGFTQRYGVTRLVWYEMHDSVLTAIPREKQLKKYKRDWKINLIERANPNWEDLYPGFFIEQGPFAHLQPREPSL